MSLSMNAATTTTTIQQLRLCKALHGEFFVVFVVAICCVVVVWLIGASLAHSEVVMSLLVHSEVVMSLLVACFLATAVNSAIGFANKLFS